MDNRLIIFEVHSNILEKNCFRISIKVLADIEGAIAKLFFLMLIAHRKIHLNLRKNHIANSS